MEAVCSSETLASSYKSTWFYNQEDEHRHLHHRENLKSNKAIMLQFRRMPEYIGVQYMYKSNAFLIS
jgi:hypothetical protein